MSVSESVAISGRIPSEAASSRPLRQRWQNSVVALATPPSRRLPRRLKSRWARTIAALAEPIVNDAMAGLTSLRESDVSALSRRIVVSTSARLLSVPTMIPAPICPSSIMLATWTMPLSSPRQAFETS